MFYTVCVDYTESTFIRVVYAHFVEFVIGDKPMVKSAELSVFKICIFRIMHDVDKKIHNLIVRKERSAFVILLLSSSPSM